MLAGQPPREAKHPTHSDTTLIWKTCQNSAGSSLSAFSRHIVEVGKVQLFRVFRLFLSGLRPLPLGGGVMLSPMQPTRCLRKRPGGLNKNFKNAP